MIFPLVCLGYKLRCNNANFLSPSWVGLDWGNVNVWMDIITNITIVPGKFVDNNKIQFSGNFSVYSMIIFKIHNINTIATLTLYWNY